MAIESNYSAVLIFICIHNVLFFCVQCLLRGNAFDKTRAEILLSCKLG